MDNAKIAEILAAARLGCCDDNRPHCDYHRGYEDALHIAQHEDAKKTRLLEGGLA